MIGTKSLLEDLAAGWVRLEEDMTSIRGVLVARGAKSIHCAADAREEIEDQEAYRCVRDRRELERGLAADANPSSANLRSARGEMSLADGSFGAG